MEDVVMITTNKRQSIPAFGNWDYCSDLPITQYFESAVQAGLVRGCQFHGEAAAGDDLFKLPPLRASCGGRVKKGDEKQHQRGQERKQGKVFDDAAVGGGARLRRDPKAVDEDLYKIPPELLYKKPKRKRVLRSLWSGCMGLHCIA
ncbi:uncharacterized protein LOC122006870 isoform X1 [Zingiber officinale]|uniref:Uncharacterized protein n=1 Tax=Zingiber officinale TaxID=94328 RepID=A0A8J5FNW6_ZINOF|nr:uncharacterized protein LOC122006870 isoform X1 [Zingiber officinale]XP_042418478.1 uncharacterized protein LOC122006870 isoform X1 [Zingiber officinale]XP_042418479.1 uncharacterized protein LOC122006870 isoform X1 [Zingiber officinale]KAG6490928.1 hypothetical protein ZIOFF_052260 [Zingiber officinale]